MSKYSRSGLGLQSLLPQDASKARNVAWVLSGNGKENKSYKLAGRHEIWKGD